MRVRWYEVQNPYSQGTNQKIERLVMVEGVVLGAFRSWFTTYLIVALDNGDIREIKAAKVRTLI